MFAKKAFITVTSGPVGGIVYGHLSQFSEHYAVCGFDRSRELSDPCPPGPGCIVPHDCFYLVDVAGPTGSAAPLRSPRFVPSPGQLLGALDQPVIDKNSGPCPMQKQVLSIVTSTNCNWMLNG